MQDPATMVLLGKLKTLAKQAGTHIDLVKMSRNKGYAELMLEELGNSDDPELMLIVIKLMIRYGMFGVPNVMTGAEKNRDDAR